MALRRLPFKLERLARLQEVLAGAILVQPPQGVKGAKFELDHYGGDDVFVEAEFRGETRQP